jgi:ADP-ribose pyrophosphatase YjhB (NUDIX family)
LPGGFVDMNETAEEALIRELKEELDIDVKEMEYLFSLPNEYDFSGVIVHTLDLFFRVVVDDDVEIKACDDVALAQFYDLKDVNIDDIGLDSIKKAIVKIKNDN